MRWLFFLLGCAGQAAALALLFRAGWFAAPHGRAGMKPVRGPLLLLGSGAGVLFLFALWERHFVLALGQAAAFALCLLGGGPRRTAPPATKDRDRGSA